MDGRTMQFVQRGRGRATGSASARRLARPTVLAVVLASLALSSCGFHLQGKVALPALFDRTCIETPLDEPLLKRQLALALELSGAKVLPEREGATAIVRVTSARSEQRVLSVSAEGRPREYEVVYKVRFEVLQGERRVLAPTELELRRGYPFDESDVLARQREAGVLLAEMQREMATLIHRRLAAVAPLLAKG